MPKGRKRAREEERTAEGNEENEDSIVGIKKQKEQKYREHWIS